jgi:quercetin dioxygenase-like cupin family protein
MAASRTLPPSPQPFAAHRDAQLTLITEVEGRALSSPVELRQLMVTPNMVLVETRFAAGEGSRPHLHADHDSIVYVVSGRMRAVIDGRSFEAGPGDCWYNAPGVTHHLEAIEPTTCVEIKSPPIRTW